MTADIIEREMTKAELACLKEGFDEHGLEFGVKLQAQRRITFVVMDGDNFVGCASGLTDHNWFHLTDLWLDKDFRGQGLGSKLMGEIEERVLSEGITKMYTWTAGYEAPDFYKNLGYEVFTELEDYYPEGYSRIGLRKALGEGK